MAHRRHSHLSTFGGKSWVPVLDRLINSLGPVYGFGSEVSAGIPTNLLKLHGSLNWAVRSDTEEVLPLTLQDYFSKYSHKGYKAGDSCNIPIGSELQDYYTKFTNEKINQEPVIVPPTWNKTDYHHLLANIWGLAAKELEEAEYIFIIGYSLPETDAFFRLLYGLGTVGATPLKKIAAFNPDSTGTIEQRFRDMLGPGALARFDFRELTFDKSIDDIRPMFPKRK